MVIYDLHIGGTGLGPAKADAPLVIDANAPLTRAVSTQGLQPVPRRHPKILDGSRSVEIGELARGDFLESAPLGRTVGLPEKARGRLVSEALDHGCMMEYVSRIVKR